MGRGQIGQIAGIFRFMKEMNSDYVDQFDYRRV